MSAQSCESLRTQLLEPLAACMSGVAQAVYRRGMGDQEIPLDKVCQAEIRVAIDKAIDLLQGGIEAALPHLLQHDRQLRFRAGAVIRARLCDGRSMGRQGRNQ